MKDIVETKHWEGGGGDKMQASMRGSYGRHSGDKTLQMIISRCCSRRRPDYSSRLLSWDSQDAC